MNEWLLVYAIVGVVMFAVAVMAAGPIGILAWIFGMIGGWFYGKKQGWW